MPECIHVMAEALAQFSRGESTQPLRTVCISKQPAYVFIQRHQVSVHSRAWGLICVHLTVLFPLTPLVPSLP